MDPADSNQLQEEKSVNNSTHPHSTTDHVDHDTQMTEAVDTVSHEDGAAPVDISERDSVNKKDVLQSLTDTSAANVPPNEPQVVSDVQPDSHTQAKENSGSEPHLASETNAAPVDTANLHKVEKAPPRGSSISIGPTNGTGANPANGAETRVYLQEHVNEWLLQGMRWVAFVKPDDGLSALAEYLQSAAAWRKEEATIGKTPIEHHKHWQAYQTWKASNSGLTIDDYKKVKDQQS